VISVDVVILTWNDPDDLRSAVESALSQVRVRTNVIVVDNGSDPPATVDERALVVRSNVNLGVGGGRNLGVRAGSAPFVCILDSDAQLRPDALVRLLAPMVDDAGIGLVAPVFTGQQQEASAGRAPTLGRKLARLANRTDVYARTAGQGEGDSWDVEFAIGACQVFRRDAFEAVGGIDARDRFGPEDVDFCLRLRARGLRVVQVAGCTCDHPARRGHRAVLTSRGLRHGAAVIRHLWRHRLVNGRGA
jgi:GT2 family glycosyltransferase